MANKITNSRVLSKSIVLKTYMMSMILLKCLRLKPSRQLLMMNWIKNLVTPNMTTKIKTQRIVAMAIRLKLFKVPIERWNFKHHAIATEILNHN